MKNELSLLNVFILCYIIGVGTLIAIVFIEGFAMKYPNSKITKYWRKNWISDTDLEK